MAARSTVARVVGGATYVGRWSPVRRRVGDGNVWSLVGDGGVWGLVGDGKVWGLVGDGRVQSLAGDGGVRSLAGDGRVWGNGPGVFGGTRRLVGGNVPLGVVQIRSIPFRKIAARQVEDGRVGQPVDVGGRPANEVSYAPVRDCGAAHIHFR